MQSIHNNEDETTQAKPMQVGSNSADVSRISEEISHSGVADSEKDVENLAIEGRDAGQDETPAFPIPIVTSD